MARNDKEHKPADRVAAELKLTAEQFAAAAGAAGIEPRMRINGVPYYATADVPRIREALAGTGEGE